MMRIAGIIIDLFIFEGLVGKGIDRFVASKFILVSRRDRGIIACFSAFLMPCLLCKLKFELGAWSRFLVGHS